MGLTEAQIYDLRRNMTGPQLEAFLIRYCEKRSRSKNYAYQFLRPDGSLAINPITIGIVKRDMEFRMAKNEKARARGESPQPLPMTMEHYILFINGRLTMEHLS
jgi:hypothetical protein